MQISHFHQPPASFAGACMHWLWCNFLLGLLRLITRTKVFPTRVPPYLPPWSLPSCPEHHDFAGMPVMCCDACKMPSCLSFSGALLNGPSSLEYTPSGTCLHHQPPEEGDAKCIWKRKQEERAYQQVARNLQSTAARIPDFCRGLPRGQGNAGTEAHHNVTSGDGGALPACPAGCWVHIWVSWFRMEENTVNSSS